MSRAVATGVKEESVNRAETWGGEVSSQSAKSSLLAIFCKFFILQKLPGVGNRHNPR